MSDSFRSCQYLVSFPTSAVTFHPPVRSSAYKSLHQPNKSRCEKTTDVDIKPSGKYGRFLCFQARSQLGVRLISASAEIISKHVPHSHFRGKWL